jgi:hypothetical protein
LVVVLLAGRLLAWPPIALAQDIGQPPAAISVADPPLIAEAAADAAGAPSLDPVLVNGHYDAAVGNSDAASQGVVQGELLRDMPLLRPGEVLETVPGLVVTQHSGDGKANQYFLRGYNLDHGTDFASAIDGVPVNLPSNAHGQGYSDLNDVIPELVERIDYLKGPYFAQSGDFSSAGSADIRYRTSLENNIASLTLGSFDYRRALLAGSTPLTDLGKAPQSASATPGTGPMALAAIEVQDYNGPWTLPEDMHKVNSVLRLSDGSAVGGWSIDANYYEAHWNSTDQVPLALIESGQLGRYSALDPTDGGDTAHEGLSAEWHAHGEQGYTRLAAYAQRYRLQLFSDFSFYELRPATGDQFEQWENRDFLGGEFVQGWNHGAWGRDSITEAGLQLRHDNIHVGLQDTEARIAFATVSDDEVSQTEAGAYVQNATSWTNWLRSLVGVREQTIAMNLHAQVLAQNSGTASGSRTLPKLSLVLGPWQQTELFANWGRGFHSNDARGVIDRIDPTTLLAAKPVPALVGALGEEIGLRTEAIAGLQSSVALWSLNSDSELVYNADSDIGSTTPNGASRRYGLEWNNHLARGRHFLFDADLAWTHARYAVNNDNGQLGDFIPNAVSKVARLRATAKALGPWLADAETRFIGSYPLSQDGKLTTPSATVTNVRVQRVMAPNCDLMLDLLNVFNRQYFDIAYEQDYRVSLHSPIVPDGVSVHPGEPRELRVSLRLKF